MRQREAELQGEEIKELYIILSETILQHWIITGTIPPNYFLNGTKEKHSFYNVQRRMEYAIGAT
eukprot:3646780-Amphidinium_carterae.1